MRKKCEQNVKMDWKRIWEWHVKREMRKNEKDLSNHMRKSEEKTNRGERKLERNVKMETGKKLCEKSKQNEER